jgi:hypothetical protein
VLGKRTAHTRSLLWPERDMSTTFVFEVVHLLGDDIRGFAQTSKDSDVFEHRRNDAGISGGFDDGRKDI